MRNDSVRPTVSRDLVITAGITVLCAGLVALAHTVAGQSPVWTVIAILAGLPLALVLPGHALTMLLLPRRTEPARIPPLLLQGMWTVGLSLAAMVMCGLLLNLIPVGLTSTSWTVGLAVLTLGALAGTGAARVRESVKRGARRPAVSAPTGVRTVSARSAELPAARRRPTLAAACYGIAVLVVAGTAVGLAHSSAAGQPNSHFAQLWLVPGKADPASAGQATLGVRNDYPESGHFHVTLRRGTAVAATWDLTLQTGQTWHTTVPSARGNTLKATLTGPGPGARSQVVVLNPDTP